MDEHTTKLRRRSAMLVLGLGMGFLMQTTMLIAQNSVEQKDIGVASSASTFFRSIGGSFGVALFGAILNHRAYDDILHSLGKTAADAFKSGAAGATAAERAAKLSAAIGPERSRRRHLTGVLLVHLRRGRRAGAGLFVKHVDAARASGPEAPKVTPSRSRPKW